MIEVEALEKSSKDGPFCLIFPLRYSLGMCGLDWSQRAGKTTLMSCLLGDRKATKGKVLLDGLASIIKKQ